MGQDTDQSNGAKRDTAVAISIDGEDSAKPPRVIASGHGQLAREIVAIAFENGVKVREDADLAGILAAVDVGNAIPSEAIMAVAEILAYLYRANRDVRVGG